MSSATPDNGTVENSAVTECEYNSAESGYMSGECAT